MMTAVALLLLAATDARPVLFLLTQRGCLPCAEMKRTLDSQDDAQVVVVDVDRDHGLAESVAGGRVDAVPQLILYRRVGKLVGRQSAETIRMLIHGERWYNQKLPPPIKYVP